MGGFIEFLASINKIAVVAFLTVFGFLVFEVKKLRDEKKSGEKPVVPQFNDVVKSEPKMIVNSTPLPAMAPIPKKTGGGSPILLIIIGVIAIVIVIVIIVITYNTSLKKQKLASTPVPIIREISSAGLKVYDTNWQEIAKKQKDKAKPGEKLYIGIQTIVEADIDRARIKVNENDWQIAHITTLFNPELKVYYKEYIVATGTAQLKIEAQLHSASDGWLGD
jgi:hypothetical protein